VTSVMSRNSIQFHQNW